MNGETIQFKARKLHCQALALELEPNHKIESRPIAFFERRSADADYTITVFRASDRIVLQPDSLDSGQIACPFDYLASALASLTESTDCTDLTPYADIPFKSGFLGYLGFGLTASQSTLAIPRQQERFIEVPDAALIVPGAFTVEDRKNRKLYLISDIDIEECKSLIAKAPCSKPLDSTAPKE